jgi:hypothetical protein
MQWEILEFVASCIIDFAPGEAMAIGALVGVLPILLVAVKRRPPSPSVGSAGLGGPTSEPSQTLGNDRLLTCVICKRPVLMSGFASHVAGHDVAKKVSLRPPPIAQNGQQHRDTPPAGDTRPLAS